jgi:hypothetical protein
VEYIKRIATWIGTDKKSSAQVQSAAEEEEKLAENRAFEGEQVQEQE